MRRRVDKPVAWSRTLGEYIENQLTRSMETVNTGGLRSTINRRLIHGHDKLLLSYQSP